MDNRINIDKAAHRVVDFHLTSMLLCGLNGAFIDGDFVALYHEERLYSVRHRKFADYFDVSADYLLGRTNAKTTDKDLRFVCDYLGMTEKTVELLRASQQKAKIEKLIEIMEVSE